MHYVCNAVFLLPILYSCRTQFDGNDLKIVVHFVTFPLTAILREIEKPSENHFCLAYCFSCKAIELSRLNWSKEQMVDNIKIIYWTIIEFFRFIRLDVYPYTCKFIYTTNPVCACRVWCPQIVCKLCAKFFLNACNRNVMSVYH